MNRELKDPFEVEHIWAKNDKDCVNQFSHYDEFSNYRNGFGGLILLPKKLNASLGAARYKEKLPIYFGQNMLAKSLNPQAYKANPSFLQFIEETGLHFKPYPDQFTKSDFEERQNLYKHICEKLWSPTRLGFAG